MTASLKNPRAGLALMSLSAWIRRQKWLRLFYRHLPQGLRDRASDLLGLPAAANARFVRTPAWGRVVVELPLEPVELSGKIGVNILGYLRGQFGLAESARMYARALIGAGVPVSLFDIDLKLPHGLDDLSLNSLFGDELPHPISILFVNPDTLCAALHRIGQARLQDRYLIACWFWELEVVPEDWLPALDKVDEILVASEFVEDAFRRVTDKPILRVPLPLGDSVDSGLQRVDFGLEESCFIFLFTFDFNSWIARKNPLAVIEAFQLAFPNKYDRVRLLIKTSNGFRHPEKFYELLTLGNCDNRIMVRDDIIDSAHIRALQRCCDAYVSLHRAEGFGLGLAEMMLAGKPVIATRWSGNLEFMDDENSCLVGCRMVSVAADDYLGSGADTVQRWAEASTTEAAEWMRRLVFEPGLAAKIGAKARESVRRTLSPQHAAETISSHLSVIRGRLRNKPFIQAPSTVIRDGK